MKNHCCYVATFFAFLLLAFSSFATTYVVYNGTTNITDAIILKLQPYSGGSPVIAGGVGTTAPGETYTWTSANVPETGDRYVSAYFQNVVLNTSYRCIPVHGTFHAQVGATLQNTIYCILLNDPDDPPNLCVEITQQNKNPVDGANLYATVNGVRQADTAWVKPMKFGTIDICFPPGASVEWFWEYIKWDIDTSDPIVIDISPETNTVAGGGGIYPGTTNSAGSFTNYAGFPTNNVNWTNWANAGGIDYSGTSATAAKDDTLKAGFGALAAGQNDILGALAGVKQAIEGIEITGGGTNGSNVASSNFPAYYSLDYQSLTNINSLTNSAVSAVAGGKTAIEGITNGFSLSVGSPVEPQFSFQFMGETVDFNPFTRWPVISTVSKWAWAISAIVAFMYWAGRVVHEHVVRQFATMQTGGVPDMNMSGSILGIGGGGNFLGMAIAFVIPGIFIALFVAAAIMVGGMITNAVSGYFAQMSTGGIPGAFWYIADNLVPMELLFALMTARVVIPLAIDAVVSVAISVARFLPAK